MANHAFALLRLKFNEWLSEARKEDPHLTQLKKDLEKLSVAVGVIGTFLPCNELFWALAIWILIFVTYLSWKYN